MNIYCTYNLKPQTVMKTKCVPNIPLTLQVPIKLGMKFLSMNFLSS